MAALLLAQIASLYIRACALVMTGVDACPKVIVSRLIPVTTGVDACPKVIVSRLIPVTTGVDAIAKWRKNAGNSVEPNSDF